MKTVERLPDLAARLGLADDPAALEQLGDFLHQVVHDLGNPMGTFGMEFYSLGLTARRLQREAHEQDLSGVEASATVVAEIQENLVAAHQNAVTILHALDSYSNTLTGVETAKEGK